MTSDTFSATDMDAVYRVMRARRDVRNFRSDPVPDDALRRILVATHQAPSVGFMQPWNFILITSHQIRSQVRVLFEEQNRQQLDAVPTAERQELYRQLKLEGILEA